MGRLDGAVGVVTGAASGIGAAIAEAVVAEGARVVAIDVRADPLHELAARLGGACAAAPADVSDESALAAAIGSSAAFGPLSFAVNAAGIVERAPIDEMPLELWQRTLSVNLTGVMLALKHESRLLKASGGGSIVNIGSLNAASPSKGSAAYAVSKAGVHMLTMASSLELGEHGIRVNTVAPGVIATPMIEAAGGLGPAAQEIWRPKIPLGRFGRTDDVAAAVLFLLGAESSWVTGASIAVDGGTANTAFPDLSPLARERRPPTDPREGP